MSAAQPRLFTPEIVRAPTRQPLLPPHATPEDMARKRPITLHLLPGAAQRGWASRPSDTPLDALRAFLPRIGRDARQLQAIQGADPEDIELRLTPAAAGVDPLPMLAIVCGLTLDETRKALRILAEADL